MGLEKAIEHGKEKRKAYKGAKAWDSTCRNHGSCGYCQSNRLHKIRKKELSCDQKIDEYIEGGG